MPHDQFQITLGPITHPLELIPISFDFAGS